MPLCDVRFDPKWIPIVRLGGRVQCPRYGLDTSSVCLDVERFLFGVTPGAATHRRLEHMPPELLLGPRLARAQHVEAHAGNDGRQPSGEVLDACRAGAAQPQPRFLDGIVGLVQRADHPVGHGMQMTSVALELFSQQVLFGHPSHFSRSLRHSNDE